MIDKAVREIYAEYFKKIKDRWRSRKKRLESPTIRTMRELIYGNAQGNDSALELVDICVVKSCRQTGCHYEGILQILWQ